MIETRIIGIVASLAPWLAPIPTAYLIGRATLVHLAWPVWVAAVGAVVVECIGLTVSSQALTLYSYNQDKRKSDPAAPLWLALLLMGVYISVAIFLTLLLDTIPELSRYAPVIYPLLSLTGVLALALRADHARRLLAVEAAKIERREARVTRLLPPVTQQVTLGDSIRNLRVTSPEMSVTEMATRLHTSRKTVYKHLRIQKEKI